ncbi:hypothetical protein MMA231_02598 [Asticcacaulis sp. MM231]|uniref:hypothetical protein n=1 Tax=Asticcacaulis sp. MM231 TaxID=3157666 RepID=UPI0032D5710A
MSRLIIKPRKTTQYGMLMIGSVLPVMTIGLGLLPVFERGIVAFGSLPDIGETLLSLAGMTTMGAFLWLYFETCRYIVENGYLSEKKFGLTLWKIHSEQAEIE